MARNPQLAALKEVVDRYPTIGRKEAYRMAIDRLGPDHKKSRWCDIMRTRPAAPLRDHFAQLEQSDKVDKVTPPDGLSLLEEEAATAGIDLSAIKQYWYKSEQFSINARAPGLDRDEILKDIVESVESIAPQFPPIHRPTQFEAKILILPIADPHFGKLGIVDKNGQPTYNLDIAQQRLKDGVRALIGEVSGYNIQKIVVANMGDWLHTEGNTGATGKGTLQDTSADYWTAFKVGMNALVEVVKEASALADTHVVAVPGNHDPTSNIYMSHAVEQYFRHSDNITFDIEPRERHYIEYGRNCIMFHHGTQNFKPHDILRIMKDEVGESFGRCDLLYAYNGHTHHRDVKKGNKQLEKTNGPTVISSGIDFEVQNRVHCETVETICGDAQDDWHYRKGYLSPAAMSAFIHCPHGDSVRIRHSF